MSNKQLILILGAFLLFKDIPIGDFVSLAATSCGL
jgi:hypothetical protein